MLLVLERAETRYGQTMWLCQCDCGNTHIAAATHLKRDITHSCGCLRAITAKRVNSKHGQFGTRLYNTWSGMKDRCDNPKSKDYANWGGRGIALCDEWQSFEPFYEWAMSNGYNEKLQIDRKDNEKGYSPDNCRWTTIKVQANNRRGNFNITFNGETHTLSQWSEIIGIKQGTLRRRLRVNKWSIKDALTIPLNGRKELARDAYGRYTHRM